MHLLNTRKLAEELARSEVTEPEKMNYLLASTLLFYIATYLSVYPPGDLSPLYYSELAIMLLINTAGIIYCFRCNGGKSGDRFIENFTCIGLPVLIWCYIIFWIPYYLVIYQTRPEWFGLNNDNAFQFGAMVTYFTIIGFEIVFYVLTSIYLTKLKTLREDKRQAIEPN